jgi:hypothetical protein
MKIKMKNEKSIKFKIKSSLLNKIYDVAKIT